MGTMLMQAGAPFEGCFEEICLSQPGLVTRIHEEYIGAGARVIQTNTLGANAVRLERHCSLCRSALNDSRLESLHGRREFELMRKSLEKLESAAENLEYQT